MKRALLVMVFAGVILASMYMEGTDPRFDEAGRDAKYSITSAP